MIRTAFLTYLKSYREYNPTAFLFLVTQNTNCTNW